MEESTPKSLWEQKALELTAKDPAPKKKAFPDILAQVGTMLAGARKAANVLVSTCVVFLIAGVGFGACMVWYNFERRHEFGIAASILKEKDPEAANELEELGKVCRNDYETPTTCVEIYEKRNARPQLARAER